MYYKDQLFIDKEINILKDTLKEYMPDNPLLKGWSSFSQCDEDGIIAECLYRISKLTGLSKTFIEFGVADGTENNSHQLLLDGYSGVWVEGDKCNVDLITEALGGNLFKNLKIINCFVDLNNFAEILLSSLNFTGEKDIDMFSIDIDGNDHHYMDLLLDHCSPKLIVVEYNAKFPPPRKVTMNYNKNHTWEGDDYFSASLQAWVDKLENYMLVSCNLSGANAFFVRSDLAKAFKKYEISCLYQPPRYWLANGSFGHKNSLKWLKQHLVKN